MTWEDLSDKRILVTGATGFIGGRLVERLSLETGAHIRVAVRNLSRLPRVARFDLDFASCDLLDFREVEDAVKGCHLVFHCAYGNRGSPTTQARVTVEGTRNLLEAARAGGVERLVHFSTFAVYGLPENGELRETSPRRRSRHVYADSKLAAEELVMERVGHGMDVVVLQPTVVYGPFGTTWTQHVLNDLATGRSILVDGGEGLCNPVYVDDVVTGALLAATNRSAAGQAFLISDGHPVPWRDFFARFEKMLGWRATLPLSKEEALAHWRRASPSRSLWSEALAIARRPDILPRLLQTREGDLARRLARRVVPGPVRRSLLRRLASEASGPSRQTGSSAIHALNPYEVEFFSGKATVRIDKARKMLGFDPHFSLEEGMRLTELWGKWAGLVPAAPTASDC